MLMYMALDVEWLYRLSEWHTDCQTYKLQVRHIFSHADGVPLSPVTPIVQTRQTLDTVTIVWGYAPVPGHAPLLGYTVTLASCPVQSSHHDIVVSVQVSHEKTELTLLNLSPSGTYCISVRGWNSLGNGEVSTAIVTTVTGLVPPPPTNVTAISLGEGLINITWQVRVQKLYAL